MVFWKNGKFHAIMWMWPFLCFKKKQKQRKMFHVEHYGMEEEQFNEVKSRLHSY